MISVPYDSTGLVPDLANGASQATQAACGLALLRDLSKNPLQRPVIITFTGGDGIQMLATRNMFLALSDPPALWRPQLAEEDKLVASATGDATALERVIYNPTALDPVRDRSAIDRVTMLVQTDAAIFLDRVFRLRRDKTSAAASSDEKQLEQDQFLLDRLRYTFIQRPKDLTGELAGPAQRYIRRTLERIGALQEQHNARRREIQSRIDLYQWLASRLGRNTDPGLRSNDNRLIELLIALDLSDHGVRCGPMYVGNFQNFTNISQLQDYRDWFSRQERKFASGDASAAWWGGINHVIDFDPFAGARAPTTWLCAPMAIGSELCQAWGVPGFSMITLDDL